MRGGRERGREGGERERKGRENESEREREERNLQTIKHGFRHAPREIALCTPK